MRIFHGEVKDGVFVFDDPNAFAARKASLEGKRFRIALDKEWEIRNQKQNNYEHWIFNVIADYTGHTMEEVKSEAKRNFASDFDEYGIPFIKGTSEMNVAEATNFIDKLVMWGQSTFPELNLSTEAYNRALKQL